MKKVKVTQMVWVYGSALMPLGWRAWECIGTTRSGLDAKCARKYGRVPLDCVAIMVPLTDVPAQYAARIPLSLVPGKLSLMKENY